MLTALTQEYLSIDGMKSARSVLAEKFPWFLHVSTVDKFCSIRSNGLLPKNPGSFPPENVSVPNQIVCLRPIGSHDTTPNRSDPRFLVALNKENLPSFIGLDWSYVGCWELANQIYVDDPKRHPDEIFSDVARRMGSIISYKEIPPTVLRVWVYGTNNNEPESWPLIQCCNENEVVIY